MENNFLFLNNKREVNYYLENDLMLNLLNINDTDDDLVINITLFKNIKSNICFSALSLGNQKRKILFNVYINEDNIEFNLKANILGIDESKTLIEANVYSEKKCNAKINLEIDGIIDGKKSSVTAIPKFIFNHNNLNAKHGVTIGAVNWKELNYLLNRGIKKEDAKYLLISSKIFACLNSLDDQQQNKYKELILNYWKGDKHV